MKRTVWMPMKKTIMRSSRWFVMTTIDTLFALIWNIFHTRNAVTTDSKQTKGQEGKSNKTKMTKANF